MKSRIVFASFFWMTAISIALAQTGPAKRSSQTTQREPNKQDRAKLFGKDKATYVFQNGRKPGQIDRVKVQLKVGGEVFDVVDKKEQREKMSLECNLDYEEKTLRYSTNSQDLPNSVRYYHRAEAAGKIGEHTFKTVLSADRALIAVEITAKKPLLFSPKGALTSNELELIDVQGNSLLMDRFLPDKPMAVGDTWNPSEKLMAQLLGLDEVGQTDVQCTLKEVVDKVARFEMAGSVAGAADGVTTAIEIKARYRYDLRRKRFDWLGLLVKERRQTSSVSDGLDVVAQLQLTILPAETTEYLNETDLKDLPTLSTPELLRLSHASNEGGWEIAYDRDWYVYRDQKNMAAVVLRRIERGDLIAQCNLSSLAEAKPDKLVSLEDFQEDIKQALSKEFKEFVEAGQTVDQAGRRVLRVMVRGVTSDLPIFWTYYHIADGQGRQMSFVFTFEEKYLERFGKADRELVESLRFVEAKQPPATK